MSTKRRLAATQALVLPGGCGAMDAVHGPHHCPPAGQAGKALAAVAADTVAR